MFAFLSIVREIQKHLENSLPGLIFCRAVVIKREQNDMELYLLKVLPFRKTKWDNRCGHTLKDTDIWYIMIVAACNTS